MKSLTSWPAVAVIIASLAVVQCSYAFSNAGPTRQEASQPPPIAGKVLQTMNSGGYTYVQLENHGKKTWVACPETPVKVGEEVAFYPGGTMTDFKSDSLKRTFDVIVFSPGVMVLPGTKAGTGSEPVNKAGASAPAASGGKVKVSKAKGKDSYTVGELNKNSAKLDKQEVSVRGKVTKVSIGIMGHNWVHIQDGTGDLVFTTDDTASVGDTVTAKGTLAKDKDFGYGYKYEVILENVTISK